MIETLQKVKEQHERFLRTTKLSEKTIKAKLRAIDNFIMHVGMLLAMSEDSDSSKGAKR